jgi:hypothetical protein
MILFLLSACSLEGDWIGNCTNAETGIQVFFEIDFDEVGRGSILGDADVDHIYENGESTSTECEVRGSKRTNRLELLFDCSIGDDFEMDLIKDGRHLIGECGSNTELILKRQGESTE